MMGSIYRVQIRHLACIKLALSGAVMAVAAGGALVPPWLETRYGVWYFVVSEEAWEGREDEMPAQTATHSSQPEALT